MRSAPDKISFMVIGASQKRQHAGLSRRSRVARTPRTPANSALNCCVNLIVVAPNVVAWRTASHFRLYFSNYDTSEQEKVNKY
jgi:hypothetical protein